MEEEMEEEMYALLGVKVKCKALKPLAIEFIKAKDKILEQCQKCESFPECIKKIDLSKVLAISDGIKAVAN